MKLKTAEFKDNLSRYLHLVRETGECITVCDRDEPIVRVVPFEGEGRNAASVWDLRRADEARQGRWEEDFEIPRRTLRRKTYLNPLED